jgi:hypothetical protein
VEKAFAYISFLHSLRPWSSQSGSKAMQTITKQRVTKKFLRDGRTKYSLIALRCSEGF